MCQLFKIHKARGECQERTKFNVLFSESARESGRLRGAPGCSFGDRGLPLAGNPIPRRIREPRRRGTAPPSGRKSALASPQAHDPSRCQHRETTVYVHPRQDGSIPVPPSPSNVSPPSDPDAPPPVVVSSTCLTG
ncbi:uncharacterized protein LOC143185111 [Calliopsis andreniformis]|uniref:uncharacterized protein LOC143185111 n=1 Tax=Calliopsis andreniformis TaxID=337506 RepID=UPI003FCCBC64